jgi:hypothetical protein
LGVAHGEVEMAMKYVCHMGMNQQELKPNETTTFEIPVPKNSMPFEAGFDFYFSANDESKTTWVDVYKQKVFVEKSAY